MVLALCAFPWACLLVLAMMFAATGNGERTNPVFYLGVAFVSALLMEAAGWLTRFGDPGFAWLKVVSS